MAQKKSEGVTIGFLGTGAMDVDNATDLIEEFIESTITSDDDPVRFVFPLTTNEFSDTLGELVEMAKQSDITYEVITSSDDKGRRSFTDVSDAAAKTYHVADVYTQMEAILTEAPSAVLEVLWDAEREGELVEIIGKFIDAGIDVKDLTDANTPMAFNGEEEEAAEAEAPTEVATAAEDATEEAEIVYARSDLEKMSRADVKEVAVALGLPPRKSSAAMIDEIMESQGWTEEEGEEVAEPVVVTQEAEQGVLLGTLEQTATGSAELAETLERFPQRLHEVLDQFLTDLGKTIEGVIFNATPEEEPAAPARRLSRAR